MRTVCGASVVLLLLFGCQWGGSKVVPCPLPYDGQQAEILKLVPVGTPRDEVLARLHAAGIEGTFGSRDSIYYCDIWNRDESTRWHLNVALLFDESGKLYQTRPGQATTGLASATADVDAQPALGPSATEPAGTEVGEAVPTGDILRNSARNAPRTPWGELAE